MKIGLISDTHDQVEQIKEVIRILNTEGVEFVIHCGDIVSPFTLQYYKGLTCPIRFVFGNNTGDIRLHLAAAKSFGLHDCEFGTFFSFKLDGKKVAVYHGEDREITEALIKCGDYDCVFSGHSHVAKIEKRREVLHVNPGTLIDRRPECSAPSIAIYDTEMHTAKIIEVV